MKNFFLKQGTNHNNLDKIRKHVDYLVDGNRKSHNKTNISPLSDVSSNYDAMRREIENYEIKQKENGGGRHPVASTTFILSLPEDLKHPTPEQWDNIYNRTIDKYCELMNENQQRKQGEGLDHIKPENRRNIEKYNSIRLDPETFKNRSVAVVHDESSNFEKSSHVHIITSNIQNGEYLKLLNQTAGKNFIKKAYDNAILEILELKPQNYVPKIDRLSEKEQEKLDLEDKAQFEERMKNNDKYKHSEKSKKGGRRRRKPSKPAHIAREESFENKKANTIKTLNNKQEEINETKKKNVDIVKIGRKEKKALIAEKAELKKTRIKVKKEINQNKIAKNEIKDFFKNILDDDFLKNFWTGIIDRCKRHNFTHKETLDIYETEKKYTHELKEKLLDNLEMMEPGAKKKHLEEVARFDKEKAEKAKKRHESNEFKTKQELDDEKFKLQQEQAKIKRPKARDPEKESIWKRLGLVN